MRGTYNQQSYIVPKIKNQLSNKQLKQAYKIQDLTNPNGIAYEIAKNFRGISISQVRKFFSQIMEACKYAKQNDMNKAIVKKSLSYPLIYYANGRGLIDDEFRDILVMFLDATQDKEDFELLEIFLTSLVAYFTVFGKK